MERVEGGSRLVANAGSTMTEIVASVQRVSHIIGEITAATSGQSSGIGSVSASMGELDQMTQQNAALVEQSAAAAESLKEQTARLAQVIDTFRLDAADARSAQSHPA
jgi:methyl-accepting chemotaxis protein